jgi:hypothetical protein
MLPGRPRPASPERRARRLTEATEARLDEHGKIVQREGPAGIRPGLLGGPDLWEVIAVHRSFSDVQRTADWLDQPPSAVETALRYYEEHRAEIDEWIGRNEEAAEAAERVARARQAAS